MKKCVKMAAINEIAAAWIGRQVQQLPPKKRSAAQLALLASEQQELLSRLLKRVIAQPGPSGQWLSHAQA